ncbi:MAG: hypothetical protein R3190_15320, partial [Thermoanaerobaculia bacterium]|nr:hypothetical protein [Thermoanaerobaculia bacterium]
MIPDALAIDWAGLGALAAQALVVAAALALGYRARTRVGPAPFLLSIGVLQFLTTLFRLDAVGRDGSLARTAGGIFLAATLFAVLLVFAREGPTRARQLVLAAALGGGLSFTLLPLAAGWPIVGGVTAGAQAAVRFVAGL